MCASVTTNSHSCSTVPSDLAIQQYMYLWNVPVAEALYLLRIASIVPPNFIIHIRMMLSVDIVDNNNTVPVPVIYCIPRPPRYRL
jgi:hypothetical protein